MARWIEPKDSMWYLPVCSKCRHESPDPNNFCPTCGRKMQVSMNTTDRIKKSYLKKYFK